MDERKWKRGGRRPGSGRKPKAKEEGLINKLKPYEADAHKQLIVSIKRGDAWALKLYFEYMYGKPIQRTDVTTGGQPIQVTPISFYGGDEEE